MKQSRFKYGYRTSASKQHKLVGDLLRSSELFKHYNIYQEYPVNKINSNFPSGREKFDWVVLDLAIVIEVMGRQHETPTDFSGKLSPEEVLKLFQAQKERDAAKKQAALEAGYSYIDIPWNVNATIEYIQERITSSQPIEKVISKYKKLKQKLSGHATIVKDRAKQYRKQRYQYLKKLKNEHSREDE